MMKIKEELGDTILYLSEFDGQWVVWAVAPGFGEIQRRWYATEHKALISFNRSKRALCKRMAVQALGERICRPYGN